MSQINDQGDQCAGASDSVNSRSVGDNSTVQKQLYESVFGQANPSIVICESDGMIKSLDGTDVDSRDAANSRSSISNVKSSKLSSVPDCESEAAIENHKAPYSPTVPSASDDGLVISSTINQDQKDDSTIEECDRLVADSQDPALDNSNNDGEPDLPCKHPEFVSSSMTKKSVEEIHHIQENVSLVKNNDEWQTLSNEAQRTVLEQNDNNLKQQPNATSDVADAIPGRFHGKQHSQEATSTEDNTLLEEEQTTSSTQNHPLLESKQTSTSTENHLGENEQTTTSVEDHTLLEEEETTTSIKKHPFPEDEQTTTSTTNHPIPEDEQTTTSTKNRPFPEEEQTTTSTKNHLVAGDEQTTTSTKNHSLVEDEQINTSGKNHPIPEDEQTATSCEDTKADIDNLKHRTVSEVYPANSGPLLKSSGRRRSTSFNEQNCSQLETFPTVNPLIQDAELNPDVLNHGRSDSVSSHENHKSVDVYEDSAKFDGVCEARIGLNRSESKGLHEADRVASVILESHQEDAVIYFEIQQTETNIVEKTLDVHIDAQEESPKKSVEDIEEDEQHDVTLHVHPVEDTLKDEIHHADPGYEKEDLDDFNQHEGNELYSELIETVIQAEKEFQQESNSTVVSENVQHDACDSGIEETTVVPPSPPPAEGGPAPRLAHLRKWPDFEGYGFNLHADKQRHTQYIGIVDAGSPAQLAGLKQNDTIVEVNGENVQQCSHREIVDKIKTYPNECTLLVVEEQTAKWYKNKGIVISSEMPNVVKQETPIKNPATQGNGATEKSKAINVASPVVPNGTKKDTKPMPDCVPRMCHLVKWPDFEGYGFNLHADKTKSLHFIGDVDDGSPAHLGGLRKGDRLIEVNGVNIEEVSHAQIIQQIKSNPSATDLLVVDERTDAMYRERGVVPRGDAPEVEHAYTPRRGDATSNGGGGDRHDTPDAEVSSKTSSPRVPSSPDSSRSSATTHEATSPQPPISPATTVDEYEVNASCSSPSSMDGPPPSYGETTNGSSSNPSRTSTPLEDSNNALFTLKASEMREMLKNRKKKDPRGVQMDLMQKYKIIEQM